VHWVMSIRERRVGWLTASSHARLREILLHTANRYGFVCPTYCFMPDHAHFVWLGVNARADLFLAAKFFRHYSTPVIAPFAWQREPFDHVLRENERSRGALCSVCDYVLANPVRQHLAATSWQYAFSGALVPGFPDMHPSREDFWDVLWRAHEQMTEASVEPAFDGSAP